MKLRIEPATDELFAEVLSLRYEPPYDRGNGDEEPVLNPERPPAAHDDAGDVVGFYYFGERSGAIFYGLGLRLEFAVGRELVE